MSSQFKGLKVAVLGGDARELVVIEELVKLGLEVRASGLPVVSNPPGIINCADPAEAVKGVAAVILPMPGIDNEGYVRAPLSSAPLKLTPEIMVGIPVKAPIFVGVARKRLMELAAIAGHKVIELAELDEVAILNAIPSAEGAIQMAMEELPITIHNSESLVIGFGRTGMTLARMLSALGAKTSVVARKPSDLARIFEMGIQSLKYSELLNSIHSFEIIFNTVPTLVLNLDLLKMVSPEALIIDLASAPGGTDFETARELGIKAILAPGLPGKVAPKTAGLILARIIPELLTQELTQEARTPCP